LISVSLGFVLTRGAVFAAHGVADYNSAAVDTFVAPVAVNMLPGGGLEAAVAIRGRSAVNTMSFVSVMLMKSVDTFGTARSEFG
jgi:hypothetical protein